ncbi:MAG: AmmeMemoRadiSam system radical SAM enzyme [Candidatus Zhuqueibacterota bacterium]
MFYHAIDDKTIQCDLCPHRCKLKDNQFGICGVRQNRSGALYSLVYGRAIAMHVDPIEKKPLFHVSPGSQSFSIATAGCNFKCKFCQNYEISQLRDAENLMQIGQELEPAEIVASAKQSGCASIAYTYTEPTVYFEYAWDTAKLAHRENILNIFVSNGFISEEPLYMMHDVLNALNVDLKSYRDEFYKKNVGARLTPVLDALRVMKKLKFWIEITTLIIPGENDSKDELTDIATFIRTELGPEVPWHISRFYPHYKFSHYPPTPIATLKSAYEIGKQQGLRYVYLGNAPGEKEENTYCYHCGRLLIERRGFQITQYHVIDGACQYCHTPLDGLKV